MNVVKIHDIGEFTLICYGGEFWLQIRSHGHQHIFAVSDERHLPKAEYRIDFMTLFSALHDKAIRNLRIRTQHHITDPKIEKEIERITKTGQRHSVILKSVIEEFDDSQCINRISQKRLVTDDGTIFIEKIL